MGLVLVLCSTRTNLFFLLPSLLVLSYFLVGVKSQIDPYGYNYCPSTTSNYIDGSKFQSNLKRLLYRSSLYINNSGNDIYAKASEGEDPDKVHGSFLCRGDVAPKDCKNCIDEASEHILRECPLKKQAIIWYNQCMVRYSDNVSFVSSLDYSYYLVWYNTQNVVRPEHFLRILGAMFDNLTIQATSLIPNLKYAANSEEIDSFQRLYGTVQCLPDLSAADCRACLEVARSILRLKIDDDARIPRGSNVLYPSCNLRYELYKFFNASSVPRTTPQLGNKDKGGKTLKTSITIGVTALLAIVLAGTSFYLVKRRRRIEKEVDDSRQEIQFLNMIGETLAEDFSNDDFHSEKQKTSQEFPVIKLDLIRAATDNFSEENKLGEGGFGPVYRGTLSNGMAIAIKRLSRTSGQGLKEFKNEVVLIARLQHRNLVRLLGCCLEGNEALLIYEFMPNKSLDSFLFGLTFRFDLSYFATVYPYAALSTNFILYFVFLDSRDKEILDWRQRFHIIKGIARGLLYLHEDSRLRIIHRDLKVSNVLLDKDMNPKISDFGMAKMFSGNQCEANTNRVVGTYGYMAPEYAMEGLFSTKSDVFSFGVLVLEIVSGRKNNGYISEHGQSLLNYAWKLWSEGQGVELMDPCLLQSSVATDITKCIHIGLLCVQQDPADRPTMSSVVFMLENDPLMLPQPSQPAFSVGRIVLRSAEPQTNDQLCSVNEVTLSTLSPR